MVRQVLRAAVLGHPIDHSLSPALHRAAYDELGLDWEYTAVDVTAGGLRGYLESLGPEWVGLSLTMPLKETVIELLTEVEPRAATVRAVNTVLLDGSNRAGFNTDITGLQAILTDARVGDAPTVTVVGAGATARSAVAAVAAVGIPQVVVLARRPEAAAELGALADHLGLNVVVGPWPPPAEALADDVVVSTVPADVAAMFPTPAVPGLLVDVLYHPWPTPLATAWKGAGGRVVGGLELLVRQAVEQVALMTGRRPSIERLRTVGSAALAARLAPEPAPVRGSGDIAQAEQ
jgi:shikimate dehydrogenase